MKIIHQDFLGSQKCWWWDVIGVAAVSSQNEFFNPLSSAGRIYSLLTSQQISGKLGLL